MTVFNLGYYIFKRDNISHKWAQRFYIMHAFWLVRFLYNALILIGAILYFTRIWLGSYSKSI